MKTIKDTKLKIIKTGLVYKIYINGNNMDCFEDGKTNISPTMCNFLNTLLNKNLADKELQDYLIENYLEKDVEELSNREFANYLTENIAELDDDKGEDCIEYRGWTVYDIDKDDINWDDWHSGLLLNKVEFCNFNGRVSVESKNNRKQFLNIIKQVIDYLENFEITEVEINK